ncbi:MAG: NmrA family NAD(P)-binding protein [Halodesulfurarchaeum sp.]
MAGRILVTGATGTVGSALVSSLPDERDRPRVASRNPDQAAASFECPVEAVEFSLERPETWGATLEGVDSLFLLWPPGTRVGSVTEFIAAAGRTGVDHVVFLSVLGAEKLPVLPHHRIERSLGSADLTDTVLRAAYFAQNLTGVHRPEIVDRDEIFIPAGSGRLGIVDARDVGEVAARILKEGSNRNRAHTLTGPVAIDFSRVARIASDVLDREIRYPDPSIPRFAARMVKRDVAPGLIAFMIGEYTVARLGFASRTTDDVEEILGRKPRSVRTFFADHRSRFESG